MEGWRVVLLAGVVTAVVGVGGFLVVEYGKVTTMDSKDLHRLPWIQLWIEERTQMLERIDSRVLWLEQQHMSKKDQ